MHYICDASCYNVNMKAAAYLRVSTLNHGQDVLMQLEPIRNLANQRGLSLFEDNIYRDEGISGAKEDRPGLKRLLADARRGKFSALIVYDVTRLGRSTKHLINVIDELRNLNVKPIFIRESIDFTSETTGTLLFELMAVLAQFERNLISERIRNALAVRKALAEKSGSLWKTGRPSIDVKVKEEVLRLFDKNLSYRSIAKEVGSISKSSVERIIREHMLSVQKT